MNRFILVSLLLLSFSGCSRVAYKSYGKCQIPLGSGVIVAGLQGAEIHDTKDRFVGPPFTFDFSYTGENVGASSWRVKLQTNTEDGIWEWEESFSVDPHLIASGDYHSSDYAFGIMPPPGKDLVFEARSDSAEQILGCKMPYEHGVMTVWLLEDVWQGI